MIFDNYFDLTGIDIIPFVNGKYFENTVNRVIYKVKNYNGYLDVWIQNERNAYYMYAALCNYERFSIAIGVTLTDMKKVRIVEKYGRGTKSTYYSAGMKAAVFGRLIIKKLYPEIDVEWEEYKVIEKAMNTIPYIARYMPQCVETTFYFDETAVFGNIKHAI